MSYSIELKKGLLNSIPKDKSIIKAELAGIIVSGAHFTFKNDNVDFTLKTENASLARYTYRLIETLFSIKPETSFSKSTRFHKHRTYILTYLDAKEMLSDLEVLKKASYYYTPILNLIFSRSKKQKIAFIKGIFLYCGSISNPERSYHLEIDAPNEAVNECCAELLESFDIKGRLIKVKNHSVLYLKDSQMISNFLALIGAHKAMLEYEDKMIVKQMRGDINRRVNCEMANISKTARASSKQIEAINLLFKTGRINTLPDELKQIAELRAQFPDDSITELGTRIEPAISRSTLYRRLKRIVEIAESMKNESEE